MFVCDSAGEICGFAAVSPDEEDPEGAVMGVWLLRAARRKGIGRELALMATDFARAAGYRKLRGTLPEGNEPALSFFSDIGSLAQVVGQGMEYELPL
jgi:ribosomal protein S18 acetylase RimI-like enzyme